MSWIRTIAAILAAVLVLAWFVVRPEELYVEHVEFDGQIRATEAELRHLADLRNGVTVWSVDLARVSAGVRRHPWVARAEAERRLPHTVVVRVEEHEPVALLAFDDGLYYVGSTGEPFLRASSDDLDYPVITGLEPSLEETHPMLARLALRDALWLLDELDARGILARAEISEVAFHRTRGYVVRTSGGGSAAPPAEVLLGFGDYPRQLDRLEALLQEGVDLSRPIHVDLAPEKVAIVRPLEVAPAR